jgi:hypothetical protein
MEECYRGSLALICQHKLFVFTLLLLNHHLCVFYLQINHSLSNKSRCKGIYSCTYGPGSPKLHSFYFAILMH